MFHSAALEPHRSSPTKLSTLNFYLLLLLCAMSLSDSLPKASADPSSLFFRHPKWTNLPPSGGSLVSGRGNFRPGFYSRDAGSFLSEPSFGFSKRSTHQDNNFGGDGRWSYGN